MSLDNQGAQKLKGQHLKEKVKHDVNPPFTGTFACGASAYLPC